MQNGITLKLAIESACAKTIWSNNALLVDSVERLVKAATVRGATWEPTAPGVKHPGIVVKIEGSKKSLLKFYPTQNKIELATRTLSGSEDLRTVTRTALKDQGFAEFGNDVVRVDLPAWLAVGAPDALDGAVIQLRDAMIAEGK